jgi:hypothetical protein
MSQLGILAAQNSSVMCWEELFDNGLTLAQDTVVNVWKGGWEWCTKEMSGSTAVQVSKTHSACSLHMHACCALLMGCINAND